MLFNLLLAKKQFYCAFFLLSCCFEQFFTIPLEIENARLKLALAIPTGVTITVTNDAIEMLPVVIDKAINHISN